ncbi:MAG TPA: thioesterase family protein [Capillimicrobium sp.]|nr:thioesterase family protein [Capillimicrobium sp.]
MSEALYDRVGDGRVRASALTRGPWDPASQHGGAPAALLAGAIEAVEPGAELRVARVTFELLRPVPVDELRVEAELVRPGRRVQLVAARLLHGDAVVVQALALRVRRAAGVAPVVAPGGPAPYPLPSADGAHAAAPPGSSDREPSFATAGVDIRFASGDYRVPGPAFAWIALRAPVVAGADPSPLQRAMAAADFPNGLSSVLDWDEHLFINPDLSVHLERDPVGEWIGLDAETSIGDDGTGQAIATLYDARGRIGRAVQSLYVDRR